MARVGRAGGGDDLNADVLAAPLLGQVRELLVHDFRGSDAAVEHGFVHDRDEVNRLRLAVDRLALEVDPGGYPAFDQVVGSVRAFVQRTGVVGGLERAGDDDRMLRQIRG